MPVPGSIDPQKWRENREYLHGLDLFNHGYYWEAHEAWESLWHACGRRGTTANFLKGLIQLAAAGVKVREGKRAGVSNHACRAEALFERTAGVVGARFLGLSVQELIDFARNVGVREPPSPADLKGPVASVFDFVLVPE
jgi:predicted metal-dependent hydrolase